MNTPSGAGWLGRNLLRLLLVVFPASSALFLLALSQQNGSGGVGIADFAGTLFVVLLVLVIPMAVLGTILLAGVEVLARVLPNDRVGLPLFATAAAALGVVWLAFPLVREAQSLLVVWAAVAGLLVLGIWAETDREV